MFIICVFLYINLHSQCVGGSRESLFGFFSKSRPQILGEGRGSRGNGHWDSPYIPLCIPLPNFGEKRELKGRIEAAVRKSVEIGYKTQVQSTEARCTEGKTAPILPNILVMLYLIVLRLFVCSL